MKIVSLEEVKDLTPIIYDWIKSEWGELEILNYFNKISDHTNSTDKLPKSLVAISNKGEPIGTISILLNDMDIRPELNPWLGCLFVVKDFRRRSVARALISCCEVMAWELGIKTLYLFTSKIELLANQLGWISIERVFFENEDVVIMYKEFR